MAKLSVVINTLNEERNIAEAIKSVAKIADQIVVVDMKSTDATRTIAKKAGADVFEHKRMGYVEPARNFAISKAKGEWILILDADERVSPDLALKIKELIDTSDADYFRLPRKNIIFGKWMKYSRWWPDYNIRLFRKGSVEWSEYIHSVPTTKGKGLDLEPVEAHALTHFHYISIEQYIERLNRYTSMQATNLKKKGYVFTWKDLVRKPANEFLSRFFEGQGYKDGVHGLALALLQSFSELVLYLKMWQFEKFKSSSYESNDAISALKSVQKDYNYWFADTLLREQGGFVQRIKRKFRLP